MIEKQIIDETIRYLSDESYNYAILIDGEWGCGKTYFVKNSLQEKINEHEKLSKNPRKVKYISLYGSKSIQDIQENIVWALAEEVRKIFKKKFWGTKKIPKVGSNILASSKKIGEAILKHFSLDVNTYDMVSDWLILSSYIFVFDDIERCSCPLNEVFGFINGLVEHEGTKVILVSNEKEILVSARDKHRELQYELALSDKIIWPKRDEHRIRVNDSKLISIKELEERRQILFPDEGFYDSYRKIREKLIGVTLHYQPNTKNVINNLIEKSNMQSALKENLFEHVNNFYSTMQMYSHHNLRTFQFYLSKIGYLYLKFCELDIEPVYRSKALSFMIEDCFWWAVRFKGNIPIPTNEWDRVRYDTQKRSEVIKEYVETGNFRHERFQVDMLKYVEEELRMKVANDDPFNLLKHQYFLHTQEWCENQLKEIKVKLQENRYPLHIYEKIIILLVRLTEMGFPEVHLIEAKTLMIGNIPKMKKLLELGDDLFFIEDKEFKKHVKDNLADINKVIIEQTGQQRYLVMEEVLSDERWVDSLDVYLRPNGEPYIQDVSLFAKAKAHKWLDVILASSSEEIYLFRQILICVYPQNTIRESARQDLPVIKEIIDGINPEEQDDLIKRNALKWLKEQMQDIVTLHEGDYEE